MQNIIWMCTKVAAVLLAVLSFTELVIPPNIYEPWVMGFPFSLISGIVISLLFMLLVVIGAIVAPNEERIQE